MAGTMWAAVRLFPGVKTEMGLEVVISCEAFMAFAAFEGFLSSVGAFMVLEDVLVAERAGADLACEEFVAGRIGGAGRGARGGRRGRRGGGVVELGRAAALARALQVRRRQQRRGRRRRPRGQQRARVQLGRQPRHQRRGARRQQPLGQHR